MLLSVILVVALAVRVLLDLASIAKPNWRFDAGYAALFGVVAGAVLIHDTDDVFGYAGVVVCGFFGIKALVAVKREGSATELS
jgi:hypothetical protein